ncbi:hypothetical protein NQZ68_023138 [Dissostichus eleginoides]|nr:hypothetical protein NQZ68_023138 [Dissostichus eleginoides]
MEAAPETPFGKVPGSVGFTLPPKPNCNHQRSKHDTDLRSVSRGKSILLPVREAHMQSIWNSFLYPLRKVQVRSLGVLPEELSDSSVALKGETPEVFGTVANSQYNRNPIQLGRGAGGEFLECYPCRSDFLLKSIKTLLLLAEVCAAHVRGCGMVGSTEEKWTPDGTEGGGDAR